MKKLIPVILSCAMLLAACGSSADSAPAASESTSAAASSEAASSAETIIGGADGETDIVVSDEANTANLDAAVAAIEAVNPIANPRALDDFSVENELMLTMDNLVGYKGDVTNDQADCGLVFVAQAKDGKVDAVQDGLGPLSIAKRQLRDLDHGMLLLEDGLSGDDRAVIASGRRAGPGSGWPPARRSWLPCRAP